MDKRPADSGIRLDQIAIWLSGLCMLHCIALPLLLVAIPLFEQWSGDHFHLQMLIFVVPVSTVALILGYRRHGHPWMLIWGAIGMALLVVGATWAHNAAGPVADRSLTIAGSLILAVAHYLNSRFARRHKRAIATAGN